MCPSCRSHDLRRRKRAGLKLYMASFFGRWPYRCDNCGSEFFLKRRYTSRKQVAGTEDPELKTQV
jgi:transposase-like protein